MLESRGFAPEDRAAFLGPDFDLSLHDPFMLSDMDKAVKRIMSAIGNNQSIIIYGDYDIDGLTASSLLLDGLTSLGANASVYIPDRFEEGYGLNGEALRKIKSDGADLVITVDCGITSAEDIAAIKGDGLDVIVTDHHNPPSELPVEAVAIVNPKLPSSKYPFEELAGVGVAYKLIVALQSQMPDRLAKGQEKWLLDLVALGTVCDVVPLTGENRTLVLFGLKVLAKSRRVGIRALAEASGSNLSMIGSSDLGFRLGPRLNAAGRLVHANMALELLTTEDITKAQELAAKLNHLNSQRQEQTAKIVREASDIAKNYSSDKVLVLADSDWSHGVVGIAASRVAESFGKPTIILQIQGQTAKGSARSVGDFSIIEAISSAGSLLKKFGGHHFAAGLTIQIDNLDEFRTQINQYATSTLKDTNLAPSIDIDLLLEGDLLTLEAAGELEKLEPYGNQNREPVISSVLELVTYKPIGIDLKHLKLQFTNPAGNLLSGIAFSAADKWDWLKSNQVVEVLYRLNINQWRGGRELQLEVIDMVEAASSQY